MPITTALGPSISPCASISTPANLPCSVEISFGHFNCTPCAPSFSSARTIATPTAKLNPDKEFNPQSKRHNNEKVSELPKPEYHFRPIRPRPAVCNSTASTLPPGVPPFAILGEARCNSKALLEAACGNISISNCPASVPSQRATSLGSSLCHGRVRR